MQNELVRVRVRSINLARLLFVIKTLVFIWQAILVAMQSFSLRGDLLIQFHGEVLQ